LDDALQRLALRQRRALLLREWHGLSYKEIAAELQLSPAAVETLLFRARRSLAQNLDSPQRLRSRRRVPGLHAGSLVAWLKPLFGGSAAMKVAAAGVVVASTALAGSGPPTEGEVPLAVDRSTPRHAVAATTASPRPRAVLHRAPSTATAKRGARRRQAPKGRPAERRTPGPPTSAGDAPTTPSSPAATPADTPTPAPNGGTPGTPGTPSAPAAPSLPSIPSLPTPPAPPPPVSLPPVDVPPLPRLPPLPELPKLPEPPPLPPAPQLPAVPELPKLGQ
jgi:Sigma-70, region 4